MEAIFYIGIAQSLFAAFVLFTKKDSSLPDKILAAWMIMIAFELLHMLFDIQDNPLFEISSNFSFYSLTFGPFLYLYSSKLLEKNPILIWKDASHFIPYLILSLTHLVFFTNLPMRFDNADQNDLFFVLTFIRLLCLLFCLVIYSSVVIWFIIRHQKEIRKTYSFESPKITLNWIRYITVIFVLTYFILSAIFLLNLINGNFIQTFHYIPGIGLTLISYSVSYFGFRQPSLFMSAETKMFLKKWKAGQMSENDLKAIETRIRNFMVDRKPYLNPELTIQKLSDLIDIPREQVSNIINQHLNKNFYWFVNQYRVEEAQERLTDPRFEHKTVLSIGYESGFNSKSSFNALFKYYTGMTPGEYRKKIYL